MTTADRPLKIDLHTHILPKHWPDLRKKYGYGSWIQLDHFSQTQAHMMVDGKNFRTIDCNCWSPEQRIRECSDTQVDVQVLSTVPVMFSYWAKPEDTLDLARYLNDHIAQVVAEDPKRFVGLGTLPMQAPELAVPELRRCVQELGLRGVQIGSHVNEWNLDAPELDPVWEAAQELDTLVFVHPWTDASETPSRMKAYWHPWLVGMPCETSLAVVSMTMGGVFEKFPRLKVCFAHGGGSFLATLGRIDHGFEARPDLCATRVSHPPSYYVRNAPIYIDSLVHDLDTLKFVITKIGKDRIVLGSDYPFPLGELHPGKMIEESDLDDETKQAILHKNALSLLGLDAAHFKQHPPSQQQQQQQQQQQHVDEVDYHAVLHVTRSASKQDIHNAFRTLAIQLHPDKARAQRAKSVATPGTAAAAVAAGGLVQTAALNVTALKNDNVDEKFRQLAEAYDVLSNDERRAVYERYGVEGLRNGIKEQNDVPGFPGYAYHNDPHLTFSEFFGGNNVFDEIYKKHLYDPQTGKQSMGFHNIKILPTQDQPVETALHLTLEELYLGCSKKATITRKVLLPDHSATQPETATFNLPIAPGTKAQTKLVYPKQGDQGPNKIPADVVFVVQEVPHKHFARDGVNLIYTHTLSLKEALIGTVVHIDTLDGRRLAIPVYEVISPNYTKIIPGEGMPKIKDNTHRGDLILKFRMQFPSYLDPQQKALIEQALGPDEA
ncbi:hypothetical protein RI367_000327 [Sorochytrium milnesiophthora]